MTFARPMSVMCDMHAIPILMYLSEHGPSVRTDDAGRARLMSLMDMGEDVAGRLGDIDEPMSGQ